MNPVSPTNISSIVLLLLALQIHPLMPSSLTRCNNGPRIVSSDEDHFLDHPNGLSFTELAKAAPYQPLDEGSDLGTERTYIIHQIFNIFGR